MSRRLVPVGPDLFSPPADPVVPVRVCAHVADGAASVRVPGPALPVPSFPGDDGPASSGVNTSPLTGGEGLLPIPAPVHTVTVLPLPGVQSGPGMCAHCGSIEAALDARNQTPDVTAGCPCLCHVARAADLARKPAKP